MTGVGLYEARRQPQLERIEIPIRHLPADFDGFTIAQFTDLHASMTIRRNFIQSVVDQVNQLGADVIVFTGDLVDGSVEGLRFDVAPLKELKARHGVYFITGNHEYYSGAEAWIEEARRLGMRVLLNENVLIREREQKILLAGVTDYSAGDFIPSQRSDPHKAGRSGEKPAVRILLAHQPKSIFEAASAGFDLQISGHTHGGQYYPWNFLATLTQPYIKGLHRHEKMWIYVSRGTGYWGPPLRLGVPSEVTLLTLRQSAY
jgi:predicted MPP superfamily phosphohydrolase